MLFSCVLTIVMFNHYLLRIAHSSQALTVILMNVLLAFLL